MPPHLRIDGTRSGYSVGGKSRSLSNTSNLRTSWVSLQESLAALLVPLPYVLASPALGFGIVPTVLAAKKSLDDLDGTVLEGVGKGSVMSSGHL